MYHITFIQPNKCIIFIYRPYKCVKLKKLRSRLSSGNAVSCQSLKTPVASRMIRMITIANRPDTIQMMMSIVFTLTWT